jgi:hypothetical protein
MLAFIGATPATMREMISVMLWSHTNLQKTVSGLYLNGVLVLLTVNEEFATELSRVSP